MVIVCAVSDGYYLPAPLTLLYAPRPLSPSRPSFSLLFTLYAARFYCLYPLLCYSASMSTLSLTSPYYPTILLFLTYLFVLLLRSPSVFFSLLSLFRSQAFSATQTQVQQFNL